VDHLFASTIFLPYLKSLNLDNLTIASPDMGGSKRAYAYSKALKSDVVICYKQRAKPMSYLIWSLLVMLLVKMLF
jgi:ribose-phosphate pyrophosphokinase